MFEINQVCRLKFDDDGPERRVVIKTVDPTTGVAQAEYLDKPGTVMDLDPDEIETV